MGSRTPGKILEGKLTADGLKVAIVVSRFNAFVTEKLLDGAMDTLVRHGAAAGDVTVAWVPGAFEIPLVARRLAASGTHDAVLCLGAVIRGATPHFDYVAAQAASGIAQAAWDTGVPVAFGVLTTDTVDQAVERAGSKAGNKGSDAALTAMEMVQLMRGLPKEAR